LSDFLLDLHQSLAHQGLAKSLDITIGMPTLFVNLAASRSRHISSQKIAQLRFNDSKPNEIIAHYRIKLKLKNLGEMVLPVKKKRNFIYEN